MNWQHLSAFLWLRWRLLVNQSRRAGAINAVVTMIFIVAAVAVAVPLGIGSFAAGVYLLPQVEPAHLMYVWDVVIVGFLFSWSFGMLTDLQRTESLTLSKFLHLPVSIRGAFLINYVSSLLSVTLILFVPIMLGLCLALVVTKGFWLLVSLPLAAAFLLMVTALTYQFQGWLASLMTNPRRRRTVVVIATMLFILLVQLPNLMNLMAPWNRGAQSDASAQMHEELARLKLQYESGQIDGPEFLRRQQAIIEKQQHALQSANRALLKTVEEKAWLANAILPLGWLPVGVTAAAQGQYVVPPLALVGLTAIGTASLWRAYHTTLRIYQGDFTGRKRQAAPPAAVPATPLKKRDLLVERRIPSLSEPVSAITLGGVTALLRAPEAKMMLLTPLLFGVIFGSALWKTGAQVPPPFRPLIAVGACGFVLLGLLQIMANQFGFDRDGFRVFVLCAAPRRDILLGKNLSFAPLALGMSATLVIIVEVFCRLRLDHLLAMVPQFVSMFLLFSVVMNLLSIYAPMHLAAGSMKPANPKLVPILIQLVATMVLVPLSLAPTLAPVAIEALLEWQGWSHGVPVFLPLALLECAAVVFIYRFLLGWQGGLLQSREQKILDCVTDRAA